MIDLPGLSETRSKIQSSVDDIAAHVMLSAETVEQQIIESWIGNLKLLSESAAQNSWHEVSELTDHLVEALRNSAGEPALDGAPILDSITKLQEALERSEQVIQTRSEQVIQPAPSEQPVQQAQSEPAITPAQQSPSAPPPAASASLASDPELVAEFILESRDHLSSLEGQLLALESDPANTDAVHSIFRSFHTVKGLAGFLDFPAIQAVAHEVETLLDLARNGQLAIAGPVVDVILESADYLNEEIERVEAQLEGRTLPSARQSDGLIHRVQALMTAPVESQEHSAEQTRIEPPSSPETQNSAHEETSTQDEESAAAPACEPAQRPEAAVVHQVPEIDSAVKAAPSRSAKPAASDRNLDAEAARFIKIDTSKLDFLVDMVGELVISQSILRHDEYLANAANPKLQRNLSQLSRITADVQKTAMSMRMVPVGQLFRRSVRLIRDLTRKSGKQVELDLSGEDTELDRTLVEDLADPLMHMIRNAADHGIELPAERSATGKDPLAHITLKAFHQAGHITIELSDDGRGLNREKILRKAVERGLVAEGAALPDAEVYNLIFEPGFSTADKVTDISGRGVGMDVVRRQVQKLRGRIEIQSTPGQGTIFTIKLPLTLAIIDGLVVTVGKERYIVPIYAVREMFRPSSDKVFTVEGKSEMVLVRGSLLPVVRLHKVFGVAPKSYDAASSLVVVAESGQSRFCLLVDDMLGKQEVVIKSLGESLKKVRGIAGGAIMGDGRVGLILDIDAVYGDRTHAANAS
ncbi:MAG TPA: chemotaxis protein CheA [Bryobacteraceae bacterium]|nr:chemotaxis protein CheA [Bryobacteraceae bacterium]